MARTTHVKGAGNRRLNRLDAKETYYVTKEMLAMHKELDEPQTASWYAKTLSGNEQVRDALRENVTVSPDVVRRLAKLHNIMLAASIPPAASVPSTETEKHIAELTERVATLEADVRALRQQVDNNFSLGE